MSLQSKILDLLSGIVDPSERIYISTTINYLLSVYTSGGAREDEVRDALFEVCYTVLRGKMLDVPDEEVKKRAAQLSNEFFALFGLEGTLRRTLRRFRLPGLV